jgi:hypothetical protein
MAISIGGIEATGAAVQRQASSLPREAMPLANIADRLLGAVKDGMSSSAQVAVLPSSLASPVPASPQALGSVQMLVALAAVTPQEERRRMLVAQARRGLDGLERLHGELLSGDVGGKTLEALTQWAREGQDGGISQAIAGGDPKFAALLHDIDMRVRVELAKFDIEV